MELYEGVLQDESKVREFLQGAVAITRSLVSAGKITRKPAILSGAGSAWYDVVADEFAKANSDVIEVVLRPGCYLTHDVGIYKKAQNEILARNPIAKKMGQGLKPALHCGRMCSRFPSRIARSSASASAIPRSTPACRSRRGTIGRERRAARVTPDDGWEIFGLMDQHAYLRIKPGDDVKVGDMIAFDISHPCLTFDKWRQVLVVDPKFRVTEVIETFF